MKVSRKARKALFAISSAAFAVVAARSTQAVTITDWGFPATAGPTLSSVTSSSGVVSGTATALGMVNSFTYVANNSSTQSGSVNSEDIVSTTGTANTGFTENLWRIRGNDKLSNSGGGGDGWSSQAANASPAVPQGAQFNVNTTGYININLSFDWYVTSSGVGNMQVQYTANNSVGSPTWVNVSNGPNVATDYVATSGDFYGATATNTTPNITIDLSSISAIDNDPNFAVRMIAVIPASGDSDYPLFTTVGGSTQDFTDYADAAGDTASTTDQPYNDTAGNWRFGNIAIGGTAVPEPASAGMLAVGGLGLLGRRRRARRA